jgi:uncharacterized protein (DUF983 family)
LSERLQAILSQKCPVCFHGSVFLRGITMRDLCPVCGLRFEREQGYWLGALYVAYGLAVPILSVFTLLLWQFTPWGVSRSFLVAMLVFFPLSPIVFRYSRVVWMHLDQLLDPRPESQDM